MIFDKGVETRKEWQQNINFWTVCCHCSECPQQAALSDPS